MTLKIFHPLPDPNDPIKEMLKNMGSIKAPPNPLIEAQQKELASEFHKRLVEYINEFDSKLDQEHEVGMRLVSFGQSIQFAVRDIGYYNPKLICFYGELDNGSKVQLIQHVNQISFLLLALPRANPSQPKRPIGFHREEADVEEESASC